LQAILPASLNFQKTGVLESQPLPENCEKSADQILAVLAESIITSNIEGHPWQEAPDLALWREVIKLAVDDYSRQTMSWCGLTKYRRRHAREEAALWLFSESREPGSFLWCCDWLDIQPEIILSRLHRPTTRVFYRQRVHAVSAGIEYRQLGDRRRRSVPAQVIQPNL